jgi:hypothetical protein
MKNSLEDDILEADTFLPQAFVNIVMSIRAPQ